MSTAPDLGRESTAKSLWTRGPSPRHCADVYKAALHQDVVGVDDKSVLFHDLDLMENRVRDLQATFPEGTIHAIAIKANPLLEVLRAVVEAGGGLEAASIEEVHLALAAGCATRAIVFDSPAKTSSEISEALTLGIRINANSVDELRRIAELWSEVSHSVVGLRVDPMVGSGTISTTSVSGPDTKFGIPLPVVEDALAEWCTRWPWLRALHCHIGSQGCSLSQLTTAAGRISELRCSVNAALGSDQISTIDIGGGLPTAYSRDSDVPLMSDYVAGLALHAPALMTGDVEIVTEFGRSVQAHAGWAISSVEYSDDRHGVRHVTVHLGADFLMRSTYRPEDWPLTFSALDADLQLVEGGSVPTQIDGPLCFGGDVLARSAQIGSLDVGSHLLIHDVGAYTLSMWSRHCSRGIPTVVGYRNGSAGLNGVDFEVLRAAESPADIVRFWSSGR